MKSLFPLAFAAFFFVGCDNELTFSEKNYHKEVKTTSCTDDCPKVNVSIPVAENVPIVADSINQKVFSTMKEILTVGENQYPAKDYQALLDDFMKSYTEIQMESGNERLGWQGEIKGRVLYESDKALNIELKHYTYTGGAHGYTGRRSLIFDRETGHFIPEKDLIKSESEFKALAERKFRSAYKIPQGSPINSTGLMFENEVFQLPQTYFLTPQGLLLYYNVYEIASYVDGPKELLIPYAEADAFLTVK